MAGRSAPRSPVSQGRWGGILIAMITTDAPDLARLRSEAERILPDIIATRRRLHRHPEVGLELPATQAVVVEELFLRRRSS